jgi:rhodanese-related sulfurtransferase
MKQIDRSTLQQRLGNATLVEALPEKYWRDWHLPGALNLPHDRVRELAPVLLPDRSAEIVVYCASRTCQNSHIAARVLEQMGYANVAVYPGGKQDWQEAGLAVEGASLAAA